jgi:hypothetical protein
MKLIILVVFFVSSLNLNGQDIEGSVIKELESNEVILFEQLQEKDKLTIDFSSVGCFYVNEERIIVYFKIGSWYLDYFENEKKKKICKIIKE